MDFFEWYRRRFTPVYADFVAFTQYKPQQILIEESNALAHLVQAHNPDLPEEVRKKNYEKACNHLIRATQDLHKLLWSEQKRVLDPFFKDPNAILCLNLPHDEALRLYKEFVEAAREARRIEMENVGVDHEKVIEFWENTTRKGFELLKAVDINKKFRFKRIIVKKEIIVSFLVGLASGLLANFVYSHFF